MIVLAVFSGCLIGLGVVIMFSELRPAPPRIADLIALHEGRDLSRRRRWLVSARVRVPRQDLELMDTQAETLVAKRIAYFVIGIVVPMLCGLMVRLTGGAVPWSVPVVAALLLGVLFGMTPDLALRRQAAERRSEFRSALSTYLDLVALERAAGAGASEALTSPADVCEGWVFARISDVLSQARQAGEQPWRGLAALGSDLGVTELNELADIAEDAGSVGASVLTTLLAKASAMRTAGLTDARGRANSRTSEMPVAIAMSVAGFLLLVTYPAIYRLFLI